VQEIILETKIAAPPERCFLLSLSIDLHLASTATTGERAIAGVTQGIIGQGETVTWQGRHFGLTLRHKTLITQYDRPRHFQDVMVEGLFRSFVHDHFFEPSSDNITTMRDELRFAAPLPPLGWIAEKLVLRGHLTQFLTARNDTIRRVAESEPAIWGRYLQDS
jgi:ligand-binding SRPBCC domain-containing protein